MATQTKKTGRKPATKKQTAKKKTTSSATDSAASKTESSQKIELKPVMTIAEAQSLHEELQGYLDHGVNIELDANQVHMIDTAGLQLLLAFVRELKNQNRTLTWIGASPAFKETAALLGLTELLGIP